MHVDKIRIVNALYDGSLHDWVQFKWSDTNRALYKWEQDYYSSKIIRSKLKHTKDYPFYHTNVPEPSLVDLGQTIYKFRKLTELIKECRSIFYGVMSNYKLEKAPVTMTGATTGYRTIEPYSSSKWMEIDQWLKEAFLEDFNWAKYNIPWLGQRKSFLYATLKKENLKKGRINKVHANKLWKYYTRVLNALHKVEAIDTSMKRGFTSGYVRIKGKGQNWSPWCLATGFQVADKDNHHSPNLVTDKVEREIFVHNLLNTVLNEYEKIDNNWINWPGNLRLKKGTPFKPKNKVTLKEWYPDNRTSKEKADIDALQELRNTINNLKNDAEAPLK